MTAAPAPTLARRGTPKVSLASILHHETAPRSGLAIGDWWADPATNELVRAGRTVRLEPKAMDVLMLLAAKPGSVVSREALFEAVWPGVVVGDEALTQSVIKLRRALGDDSRAPTYIETIAKRGYRLIAPVRHGNAPARPRRSLAWVAALAVVVAATGAYVAYSAWPLFSGSDSQDAVERSDGWLTVSVMPFESLGAAGEQSYLARGIGDGLLTDLSHLPGVRVIRASGAAAPGARYVVSGSVQRDGGTLRINVYLVDTRNNEQLWSDRIERPYGELFVVQDEMSRRLLAHLPAKVSEAERQRAARPYTRNLEAYDLFLRGQAHFLIRSTEDNEQARSYYRKALELDPAFARAYAGLAMTYAMDYRLREPADPALLARAFELAQSAREIDPDIAEVHWAIGFVHAQGRRHDQAIASLTRAVELDRSYADAYALLAGIHTYIGEPAKSIPLARTALRLNPAGGYLYFLVLGRAYLFAGDTEQAIINLRAASIRNPVDVEGHVMLAAALAAAGDRAGAKWEADEVRALARGFSAREWLETYPMTSVRQRERLLEWLAQVPL